MLRIILFIAKILGVSKWLVMAVGGAILFSGVYWGVPSAWNHWIAEPYRQEGRVEIQAKWNAAVEAEKDRVAKAVAEAQAEAQKTIDALEKREEELNAELDKAREEADTDPVANDCGLGADGVQRLNRFR